jgi:hypothetical protein
MVEHLPGKCKALSSKPKKKTKETTKRQKKNWEQQRHKLELCSLVTEALASLLTQHFLDFVCIHSVMGGQAAQLTTVSAMTPVLQENVHHCLSAGLCFLLP